MLTIDDLELAAFRLIRQETSRFDREGTDAELGSYVRGVISLESAIYGILVEQLREESKNEI